MRFKDQEVIEKLAEEAACTILVQARIPDSAVEVRHEEDVTALAWQMVGYFTALLEIKMRDKNKPRR